MEYLVTTPAGTYRIEQNAPEVEDLVALLDWLVETHSIGEAGPVRALSRQQVLAWLGRPTLPESAENPFPDPDVVVGEESGAGAFTRGWLPWKVQDWLDGKYRRAAEANAVETDGTAGSNSDENAPVHSDGSAEQSVGSKAEPAREAASTPAGAGGAWVKGTRQWEAPGSADERVVIVTSRGIAAPSGWVLTGPLPDPGAVAQRFLSWHWRKPPKSGLPQLWFTAEAMEAIGLPVEDADPGEVAEIVSKHFDCRVSWHQSGFFTCRWGLASSASNDGDNGEAVMTEQGRRSAQLVFLPWMPLDPAQARPNDLGVAGTIGKDTLLPDNEDEAVPILAERIAWLAGFGEGVAPASRWTTVGANFADVKRRTSSIKSVKAGPLPGEIMAAQKDLDPDLHWDGRPQALRGEHRGVETDQRSAYLASAIKLEFGYGEPSRIDLPDLATFEKPDPDFGLWHVTTRPGRKIDGLDPRLPLPVEYMHWDEERTFWATTRGVQHLMTPPDLGGAGLAAQELAIDAAWVWPHKSRLLRTWAEAIRKRILDADKAGRQDQVDMLKAMYKGYLGRMRSPKWSGQQMHHHQPVWFASITADTRFRAMTFATRIAQSHGLYPVGADVDAWMYWIPPSIDPAVLAEPEANNGRYRIKSIEEPELTATSGATA